VTDERPPLPDDALIGGPERREIVLAPSDPAWPARFRSERSRIEAALGPEALHIEHIGSTAVPGLAAKPIVDLLLAVADVEDEAAYLPRLEAAGYLLRVREPGHRMLRTPALDVHLHVWSVGDPAVERHLRFRDRLRESEEDRDRYAAVKQELAEREWPTMNHYAEAKTAVIRDILAGGRSHGGRSADPDARRDPLLHSGT
jgi:GrpB-like predicted nucleotidyltransferase (UPF0157 family)